LFAAASSAQTLEFEVAAIKPAAPQAVHVGTTIDGTRLDTGFFSLTALIATLEQRLSESLAQRRLTMFLLSAFATLALLLAAVGVYGVISYAVVPRTQEIGIRVALGGTRRTVLRLVLAQQARLILLGSAVCLALAFALSSVMSSLLYGVKAHDFTTFALSWIVLMIVAVLAGAAPAVRATRTDPCAALRNE
jgi:putative ABC transport system permease protein